MNLPSNACSKMGGTSANHISCNAACSLSLGAHIPHLQRNGIWQKHPAETQTPVLAALLQGLRC